MPLPKLGSKECGVLLLVAVLSAAAGALSVYFCPWCRAVDEPSCKVSATTTPKAEEDITVEDEIENIYVLLQQINSREYTMMDTMIRIFHYAKPHKGPTWNCPECAEIHDRAKATDTVTISRDQWEEFKKKGKDD